jgi:prephenate dehydrogenase
VRARGAIRIGRAGIVGAGQVGTMLGLALRGRAEEIALADREPSATGASLARGAGDRAASLEEALSADTVVLAVPVPEIVRLLQERGEGFAPGTLVVDTGSAKRTVVEAMRRSVPDTVHAVGGHPMAGTERPGPEGADPDRLLGAAFVLCPVRDDPEAMTRARALVDAVGARPVELDAGVHDRVVSRTSHLPHLVAAAVALAAGDVDLGAARDLAASGFAGTTRLAASDPAVVAAFLAANADEVEGALRSLHAALQRLGSALAEGPQPLADALAAARRARREVVG